ncbi:MAG: hypothetical protein sL5_03460 [Candidatus Mesenet longicola]|uniref:Uncharacterized protein n=1 Tax=Candidatus Mesenet longicola TaxID=1892558 RepID=A0A8J3HPM6_9RICK|nr:MAG: hypothetical protein sGL2_07710 [Candidatus Mesenet longicola]GHM59353.1 MAG: hypothetical protein sL5_03460 [Candidatus Mesenet longicola]
MLEHNFAISKLQKRGVGCHQVLMNKFSPSGELSLGVVLGSIYQQKYPAVENDKMISSLVFQDGTKLSYNKIILRFL